MEAAWPNVLPVRDGSLAAEERAAGVAGMPTAPANWCFGGVDVPAGCSGWIGACGGSWGCAECVRACCAAGGCGCAARMQRAVYRNAERQAPCQGPSQQSTPEAHLLSKVLLFHRL